MKEIHILPGEVIGPLVDYTRLRETIERFVEDMRSERFRTLSSERQLAIYGDYLKMLGRLEILADNALVAINRSLGPSIRDEGQPSQSLGRAPVEVQGGPGVGPDERRGEP